MNQKLIKDLRIQLFSVSSITELAERRSSGFFNEVKEWMRNVESILINNKIASGAQISSFRATLISVDYDGLIPEGFNFYFAPSRIKLKRAAATIYMQKAVEIIYNYLLHISDALGNSNRRNHPRNKHQHKVKEESD